MWQLSGFKKGLELGTFEANGAHQCASKHRLRFSSHSPLTLGLKWSGCRGWLDSPHQSFLFKMVGFPPSSPSQSYYGWMIIMVVKVRGPRYEWERIWKQLDLHIYIYIYVYIYIYRYSTHSTYIYTYGHKWWSSLSWIDCLRLICLGHIFVG